MIVNPDGKGHYEYHILIPYLRDYNSFRQAWIRDRVDEDDPTFVTWRVGVLHTHPLPVIPGPIRFKLKEIYMWHSSIYINIQRYEKLDWLKNWHLPDSVMDYFNLWDHKFTATNNLFYLMKLDYWMGLKYFTVAEQVKNFIILMYSTVLTSLLCLCYCCGCGCFKKSKKPVVEPSTENTKKT